MIAACPRPAHSGWCLRARPECSGKQFAVHGLGSSEVAELRHRFMEWQRELRRIEGKRGEFRTPRSVARVLVEILEPREGRVYDPCCGAGGLLVQARWFVEAHGGREHAQGPQVYGQEVNQRTWQLAKMNLDLHGTA